MAGNSIGQIFKLTTFGESHGPAIGGVIDGCPSGVKINFDFINKELARRKTNSFPYSSSRNEPDVVEFLSGIFQNKSTGAPIAFIIKNKNQKPSDYEPLKDLYRPSHADLTYDQKYGIRDHRGGGRASARETAARVVAGAIAKLFLEKFNISIKAYVSQIGTIICEKNYEQIDLDKIDEFVFRFPCEKQTKTIENFLHQLKTNDDSAGGVITCITQNCPIGLGEPVFDKLHAELGKAMLSINAVKGFEYGKGFDSASLKGSENNDAIYRDEKGDTRTKTNHAGGILGGISNGEDIFFRVAFKPVSSIGKEQQTINKNGEEKHIRIQGRHDVCVVPRAVVIVEAMTAIVIADHILRNRSSKH